MRRNTRSIIAALAGAGALALAASAHAEGLKGVALSMAYKLDVMGVADGGLQRDTAVLDNLSVNADVDLDAAAHWRGASLHVSFLANHGGHPGDLAGSLQGVDNIEVVHARAKVYEAWIDQSLADGLVDVRAGLYDTNSEFNVTDSAGIFLGPTYGISSEIAATGPNGPSIFPSPALALRINVQPRSDVYVRFAVVNALAGTLGDPGGVNTDFSQGVILWGETGWKTGGGKIAVGAWGYSKGQPDLRDTLPSGDPKPAATHGAYVMIDQPVLKGDKGPQASAFLRFGVSDGDTTPYRAAGAVGVTASHVIASRPDSVLALGVSWGTLSAKYRANSADAGEPLDVAETVLELTYADKLGAHLTLQPDLQYIHRPSGDPAIKDAVVLGLRATVNF
ncbi:carbohydrate porin [Caulobacter sp. KR2-114]|uniref:carbohydrate porin n=1 Tax=Caulobacter sp. KR2-114 TaxID=3400912 RepID=UPI003C0301E9